MLLPLLLLFCIASLALNPKRTRLRDCAPQPCNGCPTIAELRAPGVGFALEMGGGTAVVRYHNGSYENIIHIPATPDYTELMARLAHSPSSDGFYNDFRPIHPDEFNTRLDNASVMFHMIDALKIATSQAIGHPVRAAVVTAPDHTRLQQGEINRLLNGTKNLLHQQWDDSIYSSTTAYVGYGYGLSHDYIDFTVMDLEEVLMDETLFMHIDVSPAAVIGNIRGIWSYRRVWPYRQLIKKLDTFELTSQLRDFVRKFPREIERFVLTGPSASLLEVLITRALKDLVGPQVLAMSQLDQDPAFTTARGAAELAKRRQEGAFECSDTEECKERRLAEHPFEIYRPTEIQEMIEHLQRRLSESDIQALIEEAERYREADAAMARLE